ncbi:MAG: flagellar hook-basal body protein [Vulcanimicrobiaceae bacterium]
MDRALAIAASGMAAQQRNLDVIADNLANADVTGFKAATATFAAVGVAGRVGLGTVALGTRLLLTQGKLSKSGGPFDLAIRGPGFFAVRNAEGHVAYTRDGSFARGADGRLRDAAGWHLEGLRIPSDALAAHVAPSGVVSVTVRGAIRVAGRIRLAEFAAPQALRTIGSALFIATHASGPPRMTSAGGVHGPALAFGMLERANVSIVEAMMEILTAQRAYEANAKGVQAADEMLRIADNLNRG